MKFPALSEARDKRDRLVRELERQRNAGSNVADTEAALERAEEEVADTEARFAQLRRAHEKGNTEPGASFGTDGRKKMSTEHRIKGEGVSEHHDEALRAIDRAYDRGEINEASVERAMDAATRDKFGSDSRYLAAVSAPEYRDAFAKRIASGNGAEAMLTPAEQEAVRKVGAAMAERSMLVGEGATGGFALPIQIDPTVQLSSDGALSPLRQLAEVSTISTSEWRGVTSEGVEASFAKEGEEVSDDSPELKQPKVIPARAHAFVPFSFELSQDWSSLSQELSRLFADAKDVLEADKFLYGEGEDEPEGLLNKVAEKSVVTSKTKEKVEADDPYLVQEDLPPRFQPRASWLSSLTVANQIHRFSGPGGEEAPLFNEDRTKLLSKVWSEVSGMSVKTTTAKEQVLVYGDLKSTFRICDRIGMYVSPVDHLFGEEQRPLGMRGLYAFWRVGSTVQIPNAFRVLTVKE